MDHWSRRQFVQGVMATGLGLLVGCGRLPWQAEPPTTVFRVGVLGGAASGPTLERREAFRQGRREYGWIEGQNVTLEFHSDARVWRTAVQSWHRRTAARPRRAAGSRRCLAETRRERRERSRPGPVQRARDAKTSGPPGAALVRKSLCPHSPYQLTRFRQRYLDRTL